MPAGPDEKTLARVLTNEDATRAFARQLAEVLEPGLLITLSGQLAAGKTFLVRALLGALGHEGKVKSPTFTLVETYSLPGFTVHHFDLYRLADGQELHFIGFDDYLRPTTVCLIEWPERGGAELPVPDLHLTLEVLDAERRGLSLVAGTSTGRRLLARLESASSKT
jgi:tRNA threonylcarbamoyladenosine biosynthesis protein TsaE